jgi:Zn finger protein HypA/HybF involved in hydrogenase expression
MAIAELKIKCWNCGREETITETLDETVIDFNLDKQCPVCHAAWMIKKELTIIKNNANNTDAENQDKYLSYSSARVDSNSARRK